MARLLKICEKRISDWKACLRDFEVFKLAQYRITGIIKRLNKMGIHCLNSNECFLKNANLKEADLSDSTFYGVDLGGACLKGATLKNTKLRGAYMGDADFRGADLTGALLRKARCQRTLFQGAKFNGANLLRAEFFDANLQNADFRGSDQKEVKFGGANIRSANFLGATNITVAQLVEANSLKSAVLEQGILDEIRMVRPDLL